MTFRRSQGGPRDHAPHRRIRVTMANVLLAVALAPGAVLAQPAAAPAAPDPEWSIDARTVPPPAGASEVLREAIAAAPAPPVEQRRQRRPASEAEWLAMQEASSRAELEPLAERLDVGIARDSIGGVVVYRVTPASPEPRHRDHLFLHLHGGAYVLNGGDSSATEAAMIAARVGIPTISIDYRMPPKHPFPAAVEDVVAVYRELIGSRPPGSIAIGGTSAGGGLSLATVHRLLALGLEPPGAIYGGTPWADLTKTGDTLHTNEGLDRILVTYDGLLAAAARLYAGGHALEDPLLSPVYGDFTGFPPTYLVTGTRDMFLSDTARTHRKLRAAGVVADLNVYEGLSHAEYLVVPRPPEAGEVLSELGAFLLAHLDP